jgi:hypothetical protein
MMVVVFKNVQKVITKDKVKIMMGKIEESDLQNTDLIIASEL